MYTEDVILNYKGFEPNQKTMEELKSATDLLLSESPSESCIKATFTRSGQNMYLGIVKINSSVGSFFAMAKDCDLTKLSKTLVEKVRAQLNEWKTMRFETDSTMGYNYGTSH